MIIATHIICKIMMVLQMFTILGPEKPDGLNDSAH